MAMATGDKKETAIIIARNCGLLTDSMHIFDLTGRREESTLQLEAVLDHAQYKQILRHQELEKEKNRLSYRLSRCHSRPHATPPTVSSPLPYALVLDGMSVDALIRAAQDKFIFAMRHASTVICSRMSPKQKARVIMLMKSEGICCLAIGDGANDVSMIRESSVGIGVKGKEGNAAVNSADYIIREFHHLIKLMFVWMSEVNDSQVHGRNNYRGNSYSVYLAFYENITFNMPLVWLF